MSRAHTALQRCLNSPYLWTDPSRRGQVQGELEAAQALLVQARQSFDEADEATGLKQSWGAMFRAARALAFHAGYMVEQLRCLEVVLEAHFPAISAEDIVALRRAQELAGPPAAALARAEQFVEKAQGLARQALPALA